MERTFKSIYVKKAVEHILMLFYLRNYSLIILMNIIRYETFRI